jgi:hypothetical protein
VVTPTRAKPRRFASALTASVSAFAPSKVMGLAAFSRQG